MSILIIGKLLILDPPGFAVRPGYSPHRYVREWLDYPRPDKSGHPRGREICKCSMHVHVSPLCEADAGRLVRRSIAKAEGMKGGRTTTKKSPFFRRR